MSEPFVGEIRMVGFNFAPAGWALCDGQLLAVSENDALFSLIGTTYGGDGQTTFGLLDLRSRIPVHQGTLAGGSAYQIGQKGGVERVTLVTTQIPGHSHVAQGNSNAGNSANPQGNFWAADPNTANIQFIAGSSANASMNQAAAGVSGGSQSHDNMLPFLTINFIISLFGIYPSRN